MRLLSLNGCHASSSDSGPSDETIQNQLLPHTQRYSCDGWPCYIEFKPVRVQRGTRLVFEGGSAPKGTIAYPIRFTYSSQRFFQGLQPQPGASGLGPTPTPYPVSTEEFTTRECKFWINEFGEWQHDQGESKTNY